MGKEQSPNYQNLSEEELRVLLEDLPESKLRSLLEEAVLDRDYALQISICLALLPYEERKCLALTEIKNLRALLEKSN